MFVKVFFVLRQLRKVKYADSLTRMLVIYVTAIFFTFVLFVRPSNERFSAVNKELENINHRFISNKLSPLNVKKTEYSFCHIPCKKDCLLLFLPKLEISKHIKERSGP